MLGTALKKIMSGAGMQIEVVDTFSEELGAVLTRDFTLSRAVDLSRSFIIQQGNAAQQSSQNSANFGLLSAEFTSATNVRLTRNNSNSPTYGHYFVVEASKPVQVVTGTTTSSTTNVSIAAVDPSRTLAFVTSRCTGGTVGTSFLFAEITSATNLRLVRKNSNADTSAYVAYILEV